MQRTQNLLLTSRLKICLFRRLRWNQTSNLAFRSLLLQRPTLTKSDLRQLIASSSLLTLIDSDEGFCSFVEISSLTWQFATSSARWSWFPTASRWPCEGWRNGWPLVHEIRLRHYTSSWLISEIYFVQKLKSNRTPKRKSWRAVDYFNITEVVKNN